VQSRIDAFLDETGISRAEVAEWLRLDPSTVSRKVLGNRAWKGRDIREFLSRASERLGRPVTYEEAFGTPDTTPVAAPVGQVD
jgi:hypothetical protein